MKIDKEAVAFGATVAVGAVVLPMMYQAWKKRRRPKPPSTDDTRWKKVGTLDTLTIYPLKSGQGVSLEQVYCSLLGPHQILDKTSDKIILRDRFFILFREDNGEHVVGQTYPRVIKISLKPESKSSVKLSFPGKNDLIVQIPTGGKRIAKMWWYEEVNCLDCGDEASVWLTDAVKGPAENGEEQVRIRLGYWPPNNKKRDYIAVWKDLQTMFPGVTNQDIGAFSDFTSYMLMTTSSMDELNRCLSLNGINLSCRQFRPNFYVKTGEKPFSELTWQWVKIGDVVFRFVKACKRCASTTFDPDTGVKYPNNEPLTTLNSMDGAKVTKPIEEQPIMGIHLGSYNPGIIHVGDSVYAIPE